MESQYHSIKDRKSEEEIKLKLFKILKYELQRYFYNEKYGCKPRECDECHLEIAKVRNATDGKWRCRKCNKLVNSKTIRLMKSLVVK